MHPGTVATALARYMSRSDFSALRSLVAENSREPSDGFLDFVMPEHGAATQVWAAVSPDLAGRGGLYLQDCGIGEAAPHARDERRAAQLWELSERLCAAH